METCDDMYFLDLIFDPRWNLHDVLNERKVVDFFSKVVAKNFLKYSEGKKGQEKDIMDNIKFQFDQAISMIV